MGNLKSDQMGRFFIILRCLSEKNLDCYALKWHHEENGP
jgi:hypothetical protein